MNSNKNKNTNIKLVLIANSENEKVIGEYSAKSELSWTKNAQRIFKEYCKNSNNKNDKNIKIPTEDGVFYCKFSQNKFFYLTLVSEKYPEKQAFDLIEDLIKDNIHLLIDSKGELNQPGKRALKALILDYDKNIEEDKLSSLNGDIKEIKIEMQNNVKKVLSNTDDLHTLDAKAVRIKDNADIFKKDATNLKRKTFLQNLKWKLIFGILFVVLVLVFVLPMIFGGSDKAEKDQNYNNSDKQDTVAKPVVNHTNYLFLNNKIN